MKEWGVGVTVAATEALLLYPKCIEPKLREELIGLYLAAKQDQQDNKSLASTLAKEVLEREDVIISGMLPGDKEKFLRSGVKQVRIADQAVVGGADRISNKDSHDTQKHTTGGGVL